MDSIAANGAIFGLFRYISPVMKKITGFLLACIFLAPAYSQVYTKDALKQHINSIAALEKMKGASFGFYAKFADTGEEIAGYNQDLGLTPASSQKAITTATALLKLGAGYRYKTPLQYTGRIDSTRRILYGNLVIKGSGDPTLGSEKFQETKPARFLEYVLNVLQKAGIQKIEGHVICDESAFESAMAVATWQWSDVGNYYGAGPGAVNWRDNMFYLYFNSPSTPGDTCVIIKTVPAFPGVRLLSEVKAGKKYSGDNAYIFGSEYTALRYVRGTIPPGETMFSIKGSLPDPSLLLAEELVQYLTGSGIKVSGIATTTRLLDYSGDTIASERVLLGEWASPALSSIITQTNVPSNNLFAEALHKTIGLKTTSFGSNYDGNDAVQSFWSKKGIGPGGFIIADGSGLSRCNAIAAKNLCEMMYQMTKEKSYETFYSSLPVAGQSGTLKSVGKGTRLEGNLHAKSGSMTKVRAYTGYMTNPSGRTIVFSMIFNNFLMTNKEIKDTMEQLMVNLSNVQ